MHPRSGTDAIAGFCNALLYTGESLPDLVGQRSQVLWCSIDGLYLKSRRFIPLLLIPAAGGSSVGAILVVVADVSG